MPLEEEYIHEQETSININSEENTSSDSDPIHHNIPQNDAPPPPSVNNNGDEVSIRTNSIQIGTDEDYNPKSHEELDELVNKALITPQQKKLFVFKYESWHGELPLKTPSKEEQAQATSDDTKDTAFDIYSILPELREKSNKEEETKSAPLIDINKMLGKTSGSAQTENPAPEKSNAILNPEDFLQKEDAEGSKKEKETKSAPLIDINEMMGKTSGICSVTDLNGAYQ